MLIWSAPVNAYDSWYVGPGYDIYPGYGYGVTYSPTSGVGWGYAVGPGYGMGYGVYGAQTAFSADAHGMSDLVRAEGQYNYDTAKGMLSYEQARSQYIENYQKALTAIQEKRRVTRAEEAKRREQDRENELRGIQFANSHKPMPLSQTQFDPSTGRIQWPAALATKEFEPMRHALESMIVARIRNRQSDVSLAQITIRTNEMQDALRGQILTMPLPEYTEARRFLEGLAVSIH